MRPNSKLPALPPLNQSCSPRLPSDQRRHSARRLTARRSVIGRTLLPQPISPSAVRTRDVSLGFLCEGVSKKMIPLFLRQALMILWAPFPIRLSWRSN
jgi:hypothetical protein